MLCFVRPMQLGDIPQVTEIDRESFPTMPSPSFKRELLHNKLARYLVAWGEEGPPRGSPREGGSGMGRFFSGVRHLLLRERSENSQWIVGFVGLWFMVDEAHIITIAVRESLRQQGIGERLLISAIDQALEEKAESITLEVRASNTAALALYEKYGFTKVGVRPGYYIDNREDALMMSAGRLTSASFQSSFQRLKRLHAQRWQA